MIPGKGRIGFCGVCVCTDADGGVVWHEFETSGGGLAWAVGVYGCLWDLREPEVRGRASDGATTATDMVFEREHQSGCAVGVDACWSLLGIAPVPGSLRGRAPSA